jgi:hypothetical protein
MCCSNIVTSAASNRACSSALRGGAAGAGAVTE